MRQAAPRFMHSSATPRARSSVRSRALGHGCRVTRAQQQDLILSASAGSRSSAVSSLNRAARPNRDSSSLRRDDARARDVLLTDDELAVAVATHQMDARDRVEQQPHDRYDTPSCASWSSS